MTDRRTLEQLRLGFEKVWANKPGWGSLSAVNHTTVGLRFMATAGVFFLIGGLLAMLMRTQLALPEHDLVDPALYNQLFTMHGTVMMFLFAIPMLEGLAIYLIPKLIGARDLVFPRISSLGYYCFLFGGVIIVSGLLLGLAPNSGWFMYTPLSGKTYSPGPGSDFWLLGVTFVEISALAAGVELTVSILRSRTQGMSLGIMPVFCWYILVTALMIVFGFPPLILASILLELERAAGWAFFDVARGGDPLLWQHLFWLFGHPEVYIIFLPAAGAVATLIPVFARRPLVGYRWVVFAVILTGFLSFGLWVHHMFAVGIPKLALMFFSVASMLVAVPTGIQLFAWLATLWTGKVQFSLPMLWIVGFLVIFVAGGLTGVMLALVPFDWQVHDTHFVVAHMHYVLVGGMLFPLIAAFYYWLPHVSGRLSSQRLGYWGFWLSFIGFNVTFFLMHWTGLLGMPRRVYTYEPGLGWGWLNLLSSVGGFILAAGVAMVIIDLTMHWRFGRKAGPNPWGAYTLEWAMVTPPNTYNFLSLPSVDSRHPLWDDPGLAERIANGEEGLARIDHGRRETYGSEVVTGQVVSVFHLPTNSWLPLQTALALAATCISLLVGFYWGALVFTLLVLGLVLRWSWVNGAHPQVAPLVGMEPRPHPLHSRTADGPGLWGLAVALMANGSLYLSLLFGWFFLWTVAPQWVAPSENPLNGGVFLFSGGLLTLAGFVYHRLVMRLRLGVGSEVLRRNLWVVVGAGTLHCGVLLWLLWDAPLTPTERAYDALLTLMLAYQLLHASLATLVTGLQLLRQHYGYIGSGLFYEPVVWRLFWGYTLAVFWVSYAAFVLMPLGWEVS